jgi:anti-sigma-K factor RskA
MKSHETFDELAAVYAVGALDGDDLTVFEAHLAEGCPRCAATLRESSDALGRLAMSGTPAVPPPEVKVSLMARAAAARGGVRAGCRGRPPRRRRRRSRP